MMLGHTEMEQAELGLLGINDEYTSYLGFQTDTVLYSDATIFDSLLEERNEICSSVSSSQCPSVTSEIPDYDIGLDNTLDAFIFDRSVELTPEKSPVNIKSNRKKLKNEIKISNKNKKDLSFGKWSTLSGSQQTKLLETLMETVSHKLGLREQLDIINIINPSAQLSPSDTEFFIDFDLMDDHKYDLLNAYVEKELRKLDKTSNAIEQKRNKEKHAEQVAKERKQQRLNRRQQRSKEKQEKLSKMCKQLRKERRSGLFSREQVVAVEQTPTSAEVNEEEDEIDILT